MDNKAKELYCDATIFFWILYYPPAQKKMETEKWPKAADSPLNEILKIWYINTYET